MIKNRSKTGTLYGLCRDNISDPISIRNCSRNLTYRFILRKFSMWGISASSGIWTQDLLHVGQVFYQLNYRVLDLSLGINMYLYITLINLTIKPDTNHYTAHLSPMYRFIDASQREASISVIDFQCFQIWLAPRASPI